MINSIALNTLQKTHLETCREIFAMDGSKAVKVWDSMKLLPKASAKFQDSRLYVKLSRLNTREITRLAARISEIDNASERHLCLLR